MVAGEDYGKEQLRKLGVIDLLVHVIREERADFHAASLAASDTGTSRTRVADGCTGAGLGNTGGARAPGSPGRSHAHGRSTAGNVAYPGSELNAWQRFTMTLLVRAILGGEACIPLAASQSDSGLSNKVASPAHMSASTIVSYGLLLPLLEDDHTPANRRLCPVKEAVAALKTLLCDSPPNQDQGVACGIVPVLVQVRCRPFLTAMPVLLTVAGLLMLHVGHARIAFATEPGVALYRGWHRHALAACGFLVISLAHASLLTVLACLHIMHAAGGYWGHGACMAGSGCAGLPVRPSTPRAAAGTPCSRGDHVPHAGVLGCRMVGFCVLSQGSIPGVGKAWGRLFIGCVGWAMLLQLVHVVGAGSILQGC